MVGIFKYSLAIGIQALDTPSCAANWNKGYLHCYCYVRWCVYVCDCVCEICAIAGTIASRNDRNIVFVYWWPFWGEFEVELNCFWGDAKRYYFMGWCFCLYDDGCAKKREQGMGSIFSTFVYIRCVSVNWWWCAREIIIIVIIMMMIFIIRIITIKSSSGSSCSSSSSSSKTHQHASPRWWWKMVKRKNLIFRYQHFPRVV